MLNCNILEFKSEGRKKHKDFVSRHLCGEQL